RASVSPGGKYFIDTASTVSAPPSMSLYRGDGHLVRKLGDARTGSMDDYAWGKAELFTIPSGDGYDLPAYWVLPVDFSPAKQYPVIFSVYGGPDAGTVRNSWLGLTPHNWASAASSRSRSITARAGTSASMGSRSCTATSGSGRWRT